MFFDMFFGKYKYTNKTKKSRQPPKTPKSRLATETKAEFTLGK